MAHSGVDLSAGERTERLSIIIPTYNEVDNIEPLLREFSRLRTRLDCPFEIALVDDDSPDRTGIAAREIAGRMGVPLRVITRHGERSLGKAIADGIEQTAGGLTCVMDADLSHPPTVIPHLLARLQDGADAAVASRYVHGGHTISWPRRRKAISLTAAALCRIVLRLSIRDPLSGFFIIRRRALENVDISGLGNRPLLEVLAQRSLTVGEVPYGFHNRRNGQSKFGIVEILEFVRLLIRLRPAVQGRPISEVSPDRSASPVSSLPRRRRPP